MTVSAVFVFIASINLSSKQPYYKSLRAELLGKVLKLTQNFEKNRV